MTCIIADLKIDLQAEESTKCNTQVVEYHSNVTLLKAGYQELLPSKLIAEIVPLGQSLQDSSQLQ